LRSGCRCDARHIGTWPRAVASPQAIANDAQIGRTQAAANSGADGGIANDGDIGRAQAVASHSDA
jgi:hypothetical protein